MTATVTGGEGKYTYSWTLNSTVVGATETYTVPASAVTGDVIAVTVTDEEGNTATDSAMVSGLTIAAVEPTTEADGQVGYKYVRIFFSEPLSSLDASEVEIRAVKSKQLYSIESLKLSSTGLFADVILYGSHDADGTTFLMPNTPYVATVNHDGMTDDLEFELPANAADEVVVGVNEEENVIYTQYSERTSAIHYGYTAAGAPEAADYYLGLSYSGNIGELLGRTVNFGFNGDEVITDLTVQDEVVVIDTMKYVDANKNNRVDKKDYFETNDGDKYYFEESNSATKNQTHYVLAKNSENDFTDGAWNVAGATPVWNSTFAPADGDVFNYLKLVLNPTGTIATVVYNEDVTDYLMVESVDDTVVIADKNTSMNFKGYTMFDGESFTSTDNLNVGDVVYYSIPDQFAYVYGATVSGEMDNVIHEKLDIDGTTYTWTNAKYYDDGDSKYKVLEAGTDAKSVASQKYLNSLDPDEVTLVLNMNGGVSYVQGEVVGETETTTTTYLLVGATKYEKVGFDYTAKLAAHDGTTATSVVFDPANLKSINGVAGSLKTADADGNGFVFKGTAETNAMTKIKPSTNLTYTELVDVITDNATGEVVGYKELGELDNDKCHGDPIQVKSTSSSNKFNSTTTSVGDVNGKTYAVSASTKVWVVKNDDATTAKSVSMVKFSDFALGTNVLNDADFKVYVYPDKANAKHIVIHQIGADADVWAVGEKGYTTGVIVGLTEIAKGDGTDVVVIKDITVQDAKGEKITLDADGQVVKGAIEEGDLWTLEYNKSDSKVTDKTNLAWTPGAQTPTVTYDSGKIVLDDAKVISPYSDCLILKKYTVGGVTHWDPITIGEINSSVNGWTVNYNAVSTAGNNVTADFVVVEDNGVKKATVTAYNTMATKIAALDTVCTTLAANTTVASNATKKSNADTAKLNADQAINEWQTTSGKTFTSDPSTTALAGTYTTAVGKITAYEAAALEAAPTATYTAPSAGVDNITPTTTGTGWTFAFAGQVTDTTLTATSGKIVFADDAVITVTATASKDGFATTVAITNPKVTMTNFASTKNITVGPAS